MDYLAILKRSWHTVWRYRALWVFGVILALTAGGGYNPAPQYNFQDRDFGPGGSLDFGRVSPEVVRMWIGVAVGVACALVILILVATIARYVAETAVIRMVDEYGTTGERHHVRQGFRMGWSRAAWRLFLIHLLVDVPTAVVFIMLFLLALSPLALWATRNTAAGVIGTMIAVGLFLVVLVLAIIVGVVLSLLMKFFARACVLEGLGVTASIRHGYGTVRRHLREIAPMWLIMVGVGVGWAVVMVPVGLVVLIVGLLVGGLAALAVGGITQLSTGGTPAWILAALVGIPVLILVMAVPLAFLGGLWQVFQSSVWTLAYRRVRESARTV